MPPTRAFLNLDGGRPPKPVDAAPGAAGWIELLAWSLAAGEELDSASGLPTGKRQAPRLTVTKPIDGDSRRLAAALEVGDALEECVLEVWWPSPPARPRRRIAELRERQTIRLRKVRVARIETVVADPTDDWSFYDGPVEIVHLVADKLSRTWGVAEVTIRFDDGVRRKKGGSVEHSGTVTVIDAAGRAVPGVKVKGELLAGKKSVEITGETDDTGVLAWSAGSEPHGHTSILRVVEVEGYEGGPWEAHREPTAAIAQLAVGRVTPAAGGRLLSVTIVDAEGKPAPHVAVELVVSRKGSRHRPKKVQPTGAHGRTAVALPSKWWGKSVSVELADLSDG